MRRFGVSVLIAAAALAALTPATPATAAQPDCQTDIPVVGDVDGDGQSDLIVGVPGEDSAAGIVQSTPIDTESNSTDPTVAGSVGHSAGDLAGTNHGAVIASQAGE